jgi:hypothetical protein
VEALLDALLTAIVVWLSANFSIPPNFELPHIEYAPSAKMADIRSNHTHSAVQLTQDTSDVVALYDDKRRTIILPEGWSGTTPAELSVLVHEMVHHLQNVNGEDFECVGAREKPAYLAQGKWLKQFGRSLESEFQIDMFTIVARSVCM